MKGWRKCPGLAKLAIVSAVFGCGRNLSPEGASGGAGGAADGANGPGGAAGSSCPNLKVNRFAACWDRNLGTRPADSYIVGELSFVRTVEPDVSYCVQGFPHLAAEPALNFEGYATAPFVAWEFEDAEGEPIVVQFAVEGAPADLVSAGDVVDFLVSGYLDQHGSPHAGALLERAGVPVIGFHLDLPAAFGEHYGLVIEPAHAMCAEQEGAYCSVARAIHVAAKEESELIPVAESRTVGGLTVFNAHYFDNRDCDPQGRPEKPDSEIGFFSSQPAERP
jgi:hypothetical protein